MTLLCGPARPCEAGKGALGAGEGLVASLSLCFEDGLVAEFAPSQETCDSWVPDLN